MYQPTLHRVFNNSLRYRVSVAFFYEVCVHEQKQLFLGKKSNMYVQLFITKSSFLFFLETNGICIQSNFDAAVEPAELCREKTGGVAKYEKVVYGEHLAKKVPNNFVL
jgi:hypothetical protein